MDKIEQSTRNESRGIENTTNKDIRRDCIYRIRFGRLVTPPSHVYCKYDTNNVRILKNIAA